MQNLPPHGRKRGLPSAAATPKGISERNRALLTILNRRFPGPFSVGEAASALSLTISRTQRLLAYLAGRGWLVRVRRGLYAPIPLDATDPAAWRLDPWVVAAKVFGPSCYIGGWTACEHWDLTEQIFRDTVVMTTRVVRSKSVDIQGFPFHVTHIGAAAAFGTTPVWRGQTRVSVSDPSRTLVDILDDPSAGGGIRHVGDVLHGYVIGEHRDDQALLSYARRLGNRTVFKRLGHLLETLEIEAPTLVDACRVGMSSGDSLLDPSLPHQGPVVRRWNLRVNATAVNERGAT